MLATLVPLFDGEMKVHAYSIFAQKENPLLNPFLYGSGRFNNSGYITGLDIIENIGIDTLTPDAEIFVSVNDITIFTDISSQCTAPHDRIVLLMDNSITPDDSYVKRIAELRTDGYKMAMRKLPISEFDHYKEILAQLDYILLDHKKIEIKYAKIFFGRMYPNIRLCAVNVESQEDFDMLSEGGGYSLYEGPFFRMPSRLKNEDVAPLKVNYIELLNVVNAPDFDLTTAADVIGRDPALVVSLLEMVNRMTVNSGISSVRHAAAMLGQRELKKWINTAVTKELCADRPNEITRVSLLRAKFAENISAVFDMKGLSSELFLVGLFSVLDAILDKPMDEALKMVKVTKPIENALLNNEGEYAGVLTFVLNYENAYWEEISRIMVVESLDENAIYTAYTDALSWYRDLMSIPASGKKKR